MKHTLDLKQDFIMPGSDLPSTVARFLSEGTYMRNCYKIALPKISSMPKDKGIMVTGSPGIGKSRFALPLITGLAQQGQRVSLTFTDDKVGDAFVYYDFGKDPIEVDYDNAQLAYGARHTLGESTCSDMLLGVMKATGCHNIAPAFLL